jgi:hypothetical protein
VAGALREDEAVSAPVQRLGYVVEDLLVALTVGRELVGFQNVVRGPGV